MTPRGLFIFEASVAILIISGVGFTAWQTHNIVRSFNRMVAAQEETLKEMKTSLARTEQAVRKVSGSVPPNVEKWVKALAKPLIAKTNSMVRKAQRSEIDAALKNWSARNRQVDEKQWQKLFVAMSKEQNQTQQQYQQAEKQWQELVRALREEREAAQKQVQQDEKRWLELVKALREEREAAQKQVQQDEKRWLGLMETLRLQEERSDKQYREVVQQLSKEKEQALAIARQLEEERKREINKLLEQAKQIDQQRKRQLGEFCAKRPESVICSDL